MWAAASEARSPHDPAGTIPLARPALSADRALETLSYLSSHPGDHTLSELARELEVNHASMHAVLGSLMRQGYVLRDPDRKTYRLGAALVAVGVAALDQQPAVRRAREQAHRLAEESGLVCLAAVVIDDEFLIVAAAGRPEQLEVRPRVGQRIPFAPPLGVLTAAYMPDSDREAWLARMGPGATEADRDAYRALMDTARRHGFEIGLVTPTRGRIQQVLYELLADPRSPDLLARMAALVRQMAHEDHLLYDPVPARSYDVDDITAPIFDRQRRIVAGLGLLGFDNPVPADAINRYVRTLVEATRTITVTTGGRLPLDIG